MIRIYLTSIADELDRVDPRTARLTPIRREWRDASLAKAREARAHLRVLQGGKA